MPQKMEDYPKIKEDPKNEKGPKKDSFLAQELTKLEHLDT